MGDSVAPLSAGAQVSYRWAWFGPDGAGEQTNYPDPETGVLGGGAPLPTTLTRTQAAMLQAKYGGAVNPVAVESETG